MADPEIIVDDPPADDAVAEMEEKTAQGGDEPTGLEDIHPEALERTTFLECVFTSDAVAAMFDVHQLPSIPDR